MYKEKSGIEVIVVGKRIIAYDSKANKIGTLKLNNYAWPVNGHRPGTSYGIV